jgi:hypothetical protein
LAAALPAIAAAPRPGNWSGQLDKYSGPSAKVTFKVKPSGKAMANFKIPGAPEYCLVTGFQVHTLFIPSITVARGGKFERTYVITRTPARVSVHIKGRFTSSGKATGEVDNNHEGPCIFTLTWHAHRA